MGILKTAEFKPSVIVAVKEIANTVLVVDDDAVLRDAIAFDFKRKGYRVITAGDGREALQVIQNESVDLVISDIHMPNLDGIGLLEEIKKQQISLPVFLFVGCTSERDLSPEEAYELGASAVFFKPFDRKELFRAVAHALLPLEIRLKRQDPYADLVLPVGLKFLKSGFLEQASTVNLGRGGMFVALQRRLPESFEAVEFHIEGNASMGFSLAGHGIVRWVRQTTTEDFPAGCGIAFAGLDPVSLRKLNELNNQIKYKSFIPRG